MESQVESYKANGKHEAAARLQEQMQLIEGKFTEVNTKFQRFCCPQNIEPRLSRALRELRGIEEATCLLELASEDPEAIEGQLKHCLVIIQLPKRTITSNFSFPLYFASWMYFLIYHFPYFSVFTKL